MVRSARYTGDEPFPQEDWFGSGRQRREDKQLETALEVVNKKKAVAKAAKAQKPKVVSEPPPPAFKMDDLGESV